VARSSATTPFSRARSPPTSSSKATTSTPKHTILDDDGKKAGDAYVSNPYVDEPKTILDVTISCPTCPNYICNAAAAFNDHCTKLAEKNKHTKYDALASKLDYRVVAAAFTTYGGWGDDFKKTLVDPYYKKEFKAARKNGESGWAVINDRLRCYERHVAAVICRENSCMLSSTLDARCRARAIQRSAPRRSPVADSDTEPQTGLALFVSVLCKKKKKKKTFATQNRPN